MDYSDNIKKWTFVLPALIIAWTALANSAGAQGGAASYEVVPAPDLWYNDVDGIRVGLRVRGEVPGSFEDGPHRLDAGVWLGTWLPGHPVSYYLSFTEPIPSITDFASEGGIRLTSSFRTGLHRHGLSFNKRWQRGFDETVFRQIDAGFFVQKRVDQAYTYFPLLWQNRLLYLARFEGVLSDNHKFGRYKASAGVTANMAGSHDSFLSTTVRLSNLFELGSSFALKTRFFAGIGSDAAAPEFLFMRSMKSQTLWNESGLTRGKGTIPTGWMDRGFIHVAGGPGLRGYTAQEIDLLNNGAVPQITSFGSVNIELDYPNPVDSAFGKIPVIGGFLGMQSYLFFDSGTSLGLTRFEEDRLLADAGLGFMFSLNIPDYLGNPRGIMIRYEIPAWLSHPGGEPNFKFRSLLGIGAVIPL